MTIKKGIIKGFRGSLGSGLGFLLIQDSKTDIVESIPCDNAPTVRALESAFGNVNDEGHAVKQKAGFVDKEIFWEFGDFVMAGFVPVEEATPELIKQFENQKGDG